MCLLPDVIAEKVTDLTPEFLKSRGIEFLMLDFDNTLLPYTVNTPTSEVLRWLDGLKRAKIGLCVVQQSEGPGEGFLQAAEHPLHHPRPQALFQGHPGLSDGIWPCAGAVRSGGGSNLYGCAGGQFQ